MPREMTSAVEAETTAVLVRPVILVEMQFESGWVRAWTGVGPLDWNGETWGGVGDLARISQIRESAELIANGVDVGLDGISQENIALALGEHCQGRPMNIYLGFLDEDENLKDTPINLGGYFLDVPIINEGADTSSITVTAESRLRRLDDASNRRYTDEDQKIDHPEDTGFRFVAGLQNKVIVW